MNHPGTSTALSPTSRQAREHLGFRRRRLCCRLLGPLCFCLGFFNLGGLCASSPRQLADFAAMTAPIFLLERLLLFYRTVDLAPFAALENNLITTRENLKRLGDFAHLVEL